MNELCEMVAIPVGVVGLGLMGSSIVAALLIAGHPVKAIAPTNADAEQGYSRILGQLNQCLNAGLIDSLERYEANLNISEDYAHLIHCHAVIECVVEQLEIKSQVYQKITPVAEPECIIGTNTSAIPISELQQFVAGRERFLGIHFAEPAFMTRFLEITCGKLSREIFADRIFHLADL